MMGKPFICERLGVEPNEPFEVLGYPYGKMAINPDWVNGLEPHGETWTDARILRAIIKAIESPELVIKARELTLNETQKTILRGYYAQGYKWVAQDENNGEVYVYSTQPTSYKEPWGDSYWTHGGECRDIDGGFFDNLPTDRPFEIAKLLGEE